MGELIRLDHIVKSFDDTVVLNGIDLSVAENEFVTLLGPSGCGKTTTLRIIGGFEKPDEGRVFFDGKDITDLPANQRHLNTVFQNYALFPHMTVGENIAFGMRVKHKTEQYIKDKIKYALKLVNLDGFENRRIDQMSGGQQQRIAMARAIVNEPRVLLLDEPLGALDLKLRAETSNRISLDDVMRALWQRHGQGEQQGSHHHCEGVAGDQPAGGCLTHGEIGGDFGEKSHDHELGESDAKATQG